MYYAEKLSGERLRRCYEVAPQRVRQYLDAEILHALRRLRPTDQVLELGCGYGRVMRRLASVARRVVGIDTAPESLDLGRRLSHGDERCEFLCMDAIDLRFPDSSFDAVLCLQNGICAFGVDQVRLLDEALRVTQPGGIVLLSSYSDRFWSDRLAWFEVQAAEGLVGCIDRVASTNGVIVCEDGFRVGRMTPDEFHTLCRMIGMEARVCEVDDSSVFCEIIKPSAAQHQHAPDGDALRTWRKDRPNGGVMARDQAMHRRRSIRLKGFDYSQAGAYFLTICTHDRACLFGNVEDGGMRLNDIGAIVREEWLRTAAIRREIVLYPDEFVVMPNHVHGVVWIMKPACGATDGGANVGATGRSPLPHGPAKRSLSSFAAGFKSATTRRINEHRAAPGTPVWQRNYYEHIIRGEGSLDRIRQYVLDNPARWAFDRENPVARAPGPEGARAR